jgi:hypothetical protein
MSALHLHELHHVKAKGQITIKELKKDANAMRNLRKGQLVLHVYPIFVAGAANMDTISVKEAKHIRDERIYEHIMAKEAEKSAEKSAAEGELDDKKPFLALKGGKVAPQLSGARITSALPKEYKNIIMQKIQITGKDIKRDPEVVRELMERSDIIIISKMKTQSLEEACTVSESCGVCLCCIMLIFVGGLMGAMFANFQ